MKKSVTKAEYVKLIRRTETALARELKKPGTEQDKVFVSECLESLSCYREGLAALCPKSSRSASFRFARSFLAAALALVLTFCLGATIAQAAGFRVWTAIFRHDAGYLRVDYVPDVTSAPIAEVSWEDEEMNFFDYERYAAELSENGFDAFPGEWRGFVFSDAGVRSTKTEYYSNMTMRGEDGFIRIRMIAKAVADGPTSVWGLDENIPAVHIDVNGIDAAYQLDGDQAFATWQSGNRIYSVSVYDEVGVMEELLKDIVR